MPKTRNGSALPPILLALLLISVCVPAAAHAEPVGGAQPVQSDHNRGALESDIRMFTKTLDSGNMSPAQQILTLNARGNAHMALRQHEQAVQDFERAIRLVPTDEIAYYNRGLALVAQGRNRQAILDFEKVLQINPSSSLAHFHLGNTYSTLSEYDSAIRAYSNTVKINAESAGAYFNRGNAHLALRHFEQAIADYERALKLSPKFREAANNRAIALKAMGGADKGQPPAMTAQELGKTEMGKLSGKGTVAATLQGEIATVHNGPMKLLVQRLRATAGQENDGLVSQMLKSPGDYQPMALIALAELLHKRGQLDDALFWLNAGWLRAFQDAALSTDSSVYSAAAMAGFGDKELFLQQIGNPDKLNGIVERVLKWDEATPYNYDRRWIAHSGAKVMANALNNVAQTGPLLVPREQWEGLGKKTRAEYPRVVAQMLETGRKMKTAR